MRKLLDNLVQNGDVENARLLFDDARTKTVPMYGAMMKGER